MTAAPALDDVASGTFASQVGTAGQAARDLSPTTAGPDWWTGLLFLAVYVVGGALSWQLARAAYRPAIAAHRRLQSMRDGALAEQAVLEARTVLLESELAQHRDERGRDEELYATALARIERARSAVHAFKLDLLAEACGNPGDTTYIIGG